MSFAPTSKAAADAPTLLNVDASQTGTNQETIQMPYYCGRVRLGIKWMGPAYNQRADPIRSTTGKGQSSITGYNYFADLIGGLAMVQTDKVRQVIIDSGLAWDGTLTRVPGDAYTSLTIPNYGTIRFHWGADVSDVHNWFVFNRPGGGVDVHPEYRRMTHVEFKQFAFGQDRTDVPNVEFVIERAPNFFASTALDIIDAGVLPVGPLYELLTDSFCGLDLDESKLDSASWTLTAAALQAANIRINPRVTDSGSVREAIATILEYYDGWIRLENGLLTIGYFDHGPIDISGLTTLDDDDLLEEPKIVEKGYDDTTNQTTVTFVDVAKYHNDSQVIYRDALNFQIVKHAVRETLDRPYIIQSADALRYANEYGRLHALPLRAGPIKVKRDRAAGLLPGMRFILDSGTAGLSAVYRINERTWPEAARSDVQLQVEAERGTWPSLYTPPPTARAIDFILEPVKITEERVVSLPSGLKSSSATQLQVLAARPHPLMTGFRTWLSPSGSSYDLVGANAAFASRGTLSASYTGATATIDTTVGFHVLMEDIDAVALASQSDPDRDDNELLAWIDNEILSVGAVTALGAGVYKVFCVRARYGTAAATHAISAECYIIRRDQLAPVDNAAIVPAATIHLKTPTRTQLADLDLSLADAVTVVVPGGAIATPTGLALTTFVRLSVGNLIEVHIGASWSMPVDQDTACYEVDIRRTGDPDSKATSRTTTLQEADWTVGAAISYAVRVRAITSFGEAGAWCAAVTITSATDELFGVTSLRLKTGGTDPVTPDVEFLWDLSIAGGGIGANGQSPLLKDYKVRIYTCVDGDPPSSFTLIRTDYVTDGRYNYSLDRALADGTPRRGVRIIVNARSTELNLSSDVSLDVYNAPIAAASATDVLWRFEGDFITIRMPAQTAVDFAGWWIWRVAWTHGDTPIPSPGTNPYPVGTGAPFQISITDVVEIAHKAGECWLYKIGALDTFGGDLNQYPACYLDFLNDLTLEQLDLLPPSVDPPSQTFVPPAFIRCRAAAAAGLTIRYTSDGSPVRITSDTFPGTFGDFPETILLRFASFDAAGRKSEETIRNYISTSAVATPAPAAPHIAKDTDPGVTGNVTLTCATPSAVIKYKIGGGSFTTYTVPFSLSAGTTMQAKATLSGAPDSTIESYDNQVYGGTGIEP